MNFKMKILEKLKSKIFEVFDENEKRLFFSNDFFKIYKEFEKNVEWDKTLKKQLDEKGEYFIEYNKRKLRIKVSIGIIIGNWIHGIDPTRIGHYPVIKKDQNHWSTLWWTHKGWKNEKGESEKIDFWYNISPNPCKKKEKYL